MFASRKTATMQTHNDHLYNPSVNWHLLRLTWFTSGLGQKHVSESVTLDGVRIGESSVPCSTA